MTQNHLMLYLVICFIYILIMLKIFKQKTFFLVEVLGSAHNWMESTDFLYTLCSPHTLTVLIYVLVSFAFYQFKHHCLLFSYIYRSRNVYNGWSYKDHLYACIEIYSELWTSVEGIAWSFKTGEILGLSEDTVGQLYDLLDVCHEQRG